MKTVTIQTLRLRNFKGVKDFTLEPAGQNTSVFGRNETGKTTLADAFFYLLFGKDSRGSADFQIKPVTEEGREIHNLETEVEAVLDVDGKTVTLMKRYKEKWTKKRGQAREQHTGHTTDHFIDDVPIKKKDYDTKISDIIDVNAFKLVTNPYEFAGLHWTGRRDLLLKMCGDVSDQDVVDSDDKLAALAGILNDCSIDDHRAKVKAKQKKINDELTQIPVRISENQEAAKGAEKPAKQEKKHIDNALDEAREKLQSLQSNEALSAKRVRLNEVNADIIKAQSAADQEARELKKPIQAEIDRLETERRTHAGQITDLKDRIARDENRNRVQGEAKEALTERWYEENNKMPGDDHTCPACGQDLPADQVEDTIRTFNRLKADRLDRIENEGHTLKKAIDMREKDITAAKLSIDTLEKAIAALDKDIQEKNAELSDVYVPAGADTDDLDNEKDVLESEIKALVNGSMVQEQNAQQRLNDAQARLDDWNKSKAEWEAAEKARIRIMELEQKEKDLAAEYERLEGELHLVDAFTVRKVALLEDQINSRFKMARFKLFKEQINGGIEECCDILFNGVPFDRGLNNAARINTGLDIINTLSGHYGFAAPVFVDNAESVNSLLPIDAQVISLVVSGDKELTAQETEALKAS